MGQQPYILLEAQTSGKLMSEVNEYLANGYILHGDPIVFRYERHMTGSSYVEDMWYYAQAMVLDDSPMVADALEVVKKTEPARRPVMAVPGVWESFMVVKS